jgi:RNase P subunit RPR2
MWRVEIERPFCGNCYVLLNIGASKIPSKIKFEDIIRIVVDCAFA